MRLLWILSFHYLKFGEEKFIPFYGLNDIEIADKFGYIESFNKGVDKSRWHWNTSLILTGKRKKYLSNFIEEFSKSGLTVKTIRVSKDNQPKEEISFRTQDYTIDEDSSWTESSLYQEIGRKFLWVVYKESSSNSFFFNTIAIFLATLSIFFPYFTIISWSILTFC